MAHSDSEQNDIFAFDRVNYTLIAIGTLIVVLGFILMSGGASHDPNVFYPNGDPTKTPEIFSFRRITLAPILTIIGFAVIGLSIIADKKWPILNKFFK